MTFHLVSLIFWKKFFFFFFLLTDYFWLGPLPCILFSVINIINDSILWWPCKAIRASKNLFYSHYNFYYYHYFFFSLIFPSLHVRFIGRLISQKRKKERKKRSSTLPFPVVLSRRVIILPAVEIWSDLLPACLL